MTARNALGLDQAELTQFLSDEVGSGGEIVVATPGADGYPDVALVAARYFAADESAVVGDSAIDAGATGPRAAMIAFTDSAPIDGVPMCAIVERGATYDDICAVIVRGVASNRQVAVDDVVSFAFAKSRP